MLVDLCVEALLVDKDLADQVWYAWDAREISNEEAERRWILLGASTSRIGSANLAN
jgi:hypothetical protein